MIDIENQDFVFQAEQFADIRILRYRVNGFNDLQLEQKILVWHLYNAALAGRDILWDQNCKYNLITRKVCEAILQYYEGDRSGSEWNSFTEYIKRIWFSNGIHHHYSTEKIKPDFSEAYFKTLFYGIPSDRLPLQAEQSSSQLFGQLAAVLFDPAFMPKRVCLDEGKDLLRHSACNYYDGVQQAEAEAFYAERSAGDDDSPISHGLNSRLVKRNEILTEEVYKADGRYGSAIRRIVIHLEKAKEFAENEEQREIIQQLVDYYETGCLRIFDSYSINWVKDTTSQVDFVNGFIEVYGDPLGMHGAWQSVVYIPDAAASRRMESIAALAEWFETNSPVDAKYKRDNAAGISYRVIEAIVQAGDNAPSSPIGVNLPNADWIRERHGSKSVSLGNIEDAYDQSSVNNGSIEEFYLPEQQPRIRKWGALASKLHTALHEVIGHGSGKLAPGVAAPKDSLKSYASTIEEARADLVALYFIMDQKLVEEGLMESLDLAKAEYDSFILNGLMRQLVRVEEGSQLEESHMRNRQLIAAWAFEQGKEQGVIVRIQENDKTYFRINDYEALRQLFGLLLHKVQTIKSEGLLEEAKSLVENYGVKVDAQLHAEVLQRWKKLGIAPFAGFIQPMLKPVREGSRIVDVLIEYPSDFTEQMLYYAQHHAFLHFWND